MTFEVRLNDIHNRVYSLSPWMNVLINTRWGRSLQVEAELKCVKILNSIYMITHRLSKVDSSGLSIIFFSLFPSNRHPLLLSWTRPITDAHITAIRSENVSSYLEEDEHHGCSCAMIFTKLRCWVPTNKPREKFWLCCISLYYADIFCLFLYLQNCIFNFCSFQ